MRRHGFLAVLTACVAACFAWLLNIHDMLDASEDHKGSFREAFSEPETRRAVADDAAGGLRINYFDATWQKVLDDVALQADLTLVMDRVPSGRFARRDRRQYDLDTALNILNTSLEPQGFRVFRQGRFLVVLPLDAVRTRYARPPVNDWRRNDDEPNGQRRPFVQTTASDENAPSVSWASQTHAADDSPEPQSSAGFATSVRPLPAEESKVGETDQPVQQKVIAVKNNKAAEIARAIYLVFKSRAELIKNGVNGLPTFVVRSSEDAADDDPPLFRIGIDQATNKLILEGSPARLTHLSRLVAELDKSAHADDDTVKIVPNKGVPAATAAELNDQIRRMVSMRSQAGEQDNSPADEPSEQQEEGNSLNLRGEVNVQAMQDLGILILKGNEQDVEKVARIIQKLEEMSVGSLPDIHVLYLQHMNSEAMAEMLTTVYDQLSELRQRGSDDRKTAAFIPVVQPNAILILTPAIELDAILKLANELDQKTDPEAEFRVFSLRHAIASQVVTSLEAFYQERSGLGTRIRIVADVRTNAVIVQGRENDLAEVAAVIQKMDVDQPGAVHRVEIVQLNHATAEELAETINTAILSVTSPPQQTGAGGQGGAFGGNQGAQELRDGKSVALEFLATTPAGRELLRSGILVDVRVNADVRSNSLIVSAPEASMPLLTALIRQLDREPSATAEIKVFALKNADAAQSVELLTAMFEDQNQEEQLGVQIAGTEGSASSLVPVSFAADTRTNTVLAVGGPEALSVVEAILLRLDSTQSRQRQTTVITLRNAQASLVAQAIEQFLDQQQELRDSSEDMISNIERLRQEVIVAPDDNSNSLIIEASPEYFSQITEIIQKLDATPPQVVIQALLVEVQLNNTDEFGVELGFQDPTLFTRSIIADAADLITIPQTTVVPGVGTVQSTQIVSQNPTPGLNFNNTATALGNNVSGDTRTVATQGISNFSLGRQNGDLGFGGFVFSAQSDAVSVLVRALAARRTVHVLSRPQIRTLSNNTASIEVGQQVPVVNGVTLQNNFATPNIEQQNTGIILEVTPRVTSDGVISMDVYAEKSSLAPGGVPVFTDVTTGNVVESVIIDTAIADTVVTVPNGQTIVIGGMITKNDETLERKVPWLGDLPLVGSLFRYDGTNTSRSELLIFLTPRIIYSDVDSEVIKQVESERLHFVESEAEEIHGPLFSVPASQMDSPQTGLPFPPSSMSRDPAHDGVIVEPLIPQPAMEQQPPADAQPVDDPQSSSAPAKQGRSLPAVSSRGEREDSSVRHASTAAEDADGKVERVSWWKRMVRRK